MQKAVLETRQLAEAKFAEEAARTAAAAKRKLQSVEAVATDAESQRAAVPSGWQPAVQPAVQSQLCCQLCSQR